MIRQQWIYRDAKLVGYQDWHEPDISDPPLVADMHARHPPMPPQAIRSLADDEVAFDHPPTEAELAKAFPNATRSS